MRVALFGGTFDPPHRGHVAIARTAAAKFELDTVFFAPAGRQPLKPESPLASYSDRLTMAALASAEDSHFAVSNLDAPRADGTVNYTVRTLGLLAELMPEAKIFNLVGADSWHGLARWREPHRLLALAEWIIVSRPGFPLTEPQNFPLSTSDWGKIHLLDSVHEDVSATDLRARLWVGDLCADLLPAGVSTYIQQHGLYRQSPR